jgi:RNA polymerase sigma factor (sigma-70 family)
MTGTDESTVAELAYAAMRGDERGWDGLVERFDPVLRRVAGGFRLPRADIEDVVQTTWLRAYLNLHRLETPAAIGGWLVVTARRESLRLLQRAVREFPTDEYPVHLADPVTTEALVLQDERRSSVRSAVQRLRGRQRALLETWLDKPLSYQEIAGSLGMPIGSIGPTRERAFAGLRRDDQLMATVAP